MIDNDWLTREFETRRARLRSVAMRMLGSYDDAEDALQEAWIRLNRADAAAIENLGGWLTTVVGRVCLDMLRSRKSRREDALDLDEQDVADDTSATPNSEAELILADSIGPALLSVLDTLAPSERVAFVLHDMFDLSYEEIAPIVDRSEAAARQLASRARRRVRAIGASPQADANRQREIVTAFIAASREGNFDALMQLLDPNVTLRADAFAVKMTAAYQDKGGGVIELPPEIRGASAVANLFRGRARAARLALIDGLAGAAWTPGGVTRSVMICSITGGKITGLQVVMEPAVLGALDIRLENA